MGSFQLANVCVWGWMILDLFNLFSLSINIALILSCWRWFGARLSVLEMTRPMMAAVAAPGRGQHYLAITHLATARPGPSHNKLFATAPCPRQLMWPWQSIPFLFIDQSSHSWMEQSSSSYKVDPMDSEAGVIVNVRIRIEWGAEEDVPPLHSAPALPPHHLYPA